MSESMQPADLARQAKQHLESLRAAGVEWLPVAPPPTPYIRAPEAAVSEPTAQVLHATAPAELFASTRNDSALNVEDRRHELQVLREEVARCSRCAELAAQRTQTVF